LGPEVIFDSRLAGENFLDMIGAGLKKRKISKRKILKVKFFVIKFLEALDLLYIQYLATPREQKIKFETISTRTLHQDRLI
jgi:hypothetical protein